MQCNVSNSVDKTLRVLIGIGLLSLLYFLEGNLRWLGLIGIIPILTVVFGWCPGWALLGINTCGSKRRAARRNAPASGRRALRFVPCIPA